VSIFAGETHSDPIPIPFDPPHTVTVRKLTGRECDAAREAHATGLSAGGARQWATKFRRILEGSISDKAQIEEAIADPLTGYDRFVLAASGLGAWSYDVPLLAIIDAAAKLTAEQREAAHYAVRKAVVDRLSDEGVDFIATEVLRVTKPGLFHATKADAQVAQKND
jgi:hypothetical protein